MNNFFRFFENNNEDTKGRDVIVKPERCPQNHPCPAVRVCPVDAITQKGYNAPEIDQSKCVKCGKCVKYCGFGSITHKASPRK